MMFKFLRPKALKTVLKKMAPVSYDQLPEKLHGMTTHTEREFLLDYAQNKYAGAGEVVDLGSWMGSLTIPLLIGLRKNAIWAKEHKAVHAYDLFTWTGWMDNHYDENYFGHHPREGESFLADFWRQVAPYAPDNRLVVHAGDATQAGWKGAPIELLVVDVMKSWELANAVKRDFYPYLIPGVSLVMHQDFIHYYTPWIHLLHYRLREYFEPAQDISESSSMVFRCVKKIPLELLNKTYDFEDFPAEEIVAAFQYSRSLLNMEPEWRKAEMASAEAMVYVHQNKMAEAQKIIDKTLASGIPLSHGLKMAQELITTKV